MIGYFDINPFINPDLFETEYNSRYNSILNILNNCTALKGEYNSNQYFIFSPSAKKSGYYQVTYFRHNSPVCDIMRTDITDIVKEIIDINFTITETI